MTILRTIPPGELTLGGYKITIPTYVLAPGARPPVHCWIVYRGGGLWFACQGLKEKAAKGFDGALAAMPRDRRVVLAVTEGLLQSTEPKPEPKPKPEPEPEPKPKPKPKPEPKPEPKPDPKPEPKPEPKRLEVFDADEGQMVLVVNQETGDEVEGTVVDADSRSIEVEFGDDIITFTKRSNDTWVEKGESAASGRQVILVVS